MQFKIGDLVCYNTGGEILRIYGIKKIDLVTKYQCELYYWQPMRLCDFVVEEESLRKATIEDWKKFCGKRKDIFEKHKEDFIKGNTSGCINSLFDYSKSDYKRYSSSYEEALNEENNSRHRIAKLVRSMIDSYNDESKEYDLELYLFNHFASYERDIKDLKEEKEKLKQLLVAISAERDKYKEIAEIFKESGIWCLDTDYDDCEYCLCDSSDQYRVCPLTAEQYYKLENYLFDKDKKEE